MTDPTTTPASTDLIAEFLDLWPFDGEPLIETTDDAPEEEEDEEIDLDAFLIAQQTWAP